MHILVTGATGFVGGHLVRRLLEKRARVRALARQTSRTDELEALGVEVVRGHLGRPPSDAFAGVDVVVHLAGGGKVKGPDDFYVANTESTRGLVEGAVGAGVKRFLLLSSLAAHGPSSDGTPCTEAEPSRPVSHYGKSKLAAEALLMGSELEAFVLRPPAIYGPGDTRMVSLFRAARRGFIPQLGAEGALSVLHVDDCVQAIDRVLFGDVAPGVYFVDDGARHRRGDLLDSIAATAERTVRKVQIPRPLLQAAGYLVETTMSALDRPFVFGRDKVADMTQAHWVCSSEKLQRAAGYDPQVTLAEGIQQTGAWYRAEGWI